MTEPAAGSKSGKASDRLNEEERAHHPVDGPGFPAPRVSGQDEERHQAPDPRVADSAGGCLPDDSEPRQVLEGLWSQFGQGAESLGISALAVIVLVAVDLIQPGHMKPWQVFGSVPLYVAGVIIFFRIERRGHRKRRARLPLDVSGGGRFALIMAALALSTAGGPDTDGHAGWLAFAAVVLGSAADGAWIAIVATRQRIGFWRAWYELGRRQREAQKRCWTALIGRHHR